MESIALPGMSGRRSGKESHLSETIKSGCRHWSLKTIVIAGGSMIQWLGIIASHAPITINPFRNQYFKIQQPIMQGSLIRLPDGVNGRTLLIFAMCWFFTQCHEGSHQLKVFFRNKIIKLWYTRTERYNISIYLITVPLVLPSELSSIPLVVCK